jgi:NAD-dependent dihydropyrimidine dehydrogenase PreA subunit
MTNCDECGKWGIIDGEYRGSVLIGFDDRILCGSCIKKWREKEIKRLEEEKENIQWKSYKAIRKINQILYDGE